MTGLLSGLSDSCGQSEIALCRLSCTVNLHRVYRTIRVPVRVFPLSTVRINRHEQKSFNHSKCSFAHPAQLRSGPEYGRNFLRNRLRMYSAAPN